MAAKPFRYAFLVSGEGRMMEIAAETCKTHALAFEIAVVITDRACGAVDRARAAGIPVVVVDYTAYADRDAFEQALLAALEPHTIDGLILNFNRLLGAAVQARFPDRILNTHYSLLPLFPGFGAIKKASASGMQFAGVTVHLISNGMDTGPIVAQLALPHAGSDEQALGKRLFEAAVPMQLQAWQWLAEGRIKRTSPTTVEIAGAQYPAATYAPALEMPALNIACPDLGK